MELVSLKKKEEQSMRISLGGSVYKTRIYAFRGLMYIDISRNNGYIVTGKRIMANQWLLPHYVVDSGGNFRFETYQADADDYVWYDGFNTKFRLTSYRTDELAAMEGGD